MLKFDDRNEWTVKLRSGDMLFACLLAWLSKLLNVYTAVCV
jgi:hypothetical protein